METKLYVPSSPTLQTIIAWVSKHFQIDRHRVKLRIIQQENAGEMTSGTTRKLLARAGGYIGITLRISRDMAYPHQTQYVRELPPMMVRSFEEELVLVLAHELRHAIQFSLGLQTKLSAKEMEIDAEAAGYSMVEAYRLCREAGLLT